MKITIDEMMKKDKSICYTREQVAKLWGENESLTLMEITNLDIPASDIIWAVSRFLDDKLNRMFAVDCARREVNSITDSELKKRSEYLLSRVGDIIDDNITFDDMTADSAAYWAADRAAYWSAYKNIYGDADWASDWASECQWQLSLLREYVEKSEEVQG